MKRNNILVLCLFMLLSVSAFGQTIRYNGSTRIQQYADSMKFEKLAKFHYGIWLQQSGNVGSLIYDDAGGRLGMSGGISLGGSTYGFSTRTLVDTAAGADSNMFSVVWKPQRWGLYAGTAASPVTVGGPTVKIVRRQNIDSTVTTNKADPSANAALEVQNFATTNNFGQPIGIYGGATSTSNRSFSSGNDAAGGAFYGRVNGAATGFGIGMFADGRRDSSVGRAHAAEFSVSDWSLTSGIGATYTASGIDSTNVIWISNHGTVGKQIGSGIKFGNADGIPMQYGIGFTSQNGSAVTKADIVTDDTSRNAILIRGTHNAGSIVIQDSLNTRGISIGKTSPTSQLSLYQNNSTTASTPQLMIEQKGTGDAALNFLLTGVRGWEFGIDNSDGDKIKLCPVQNGFATPVIQFGTDSSITYTNAVRGSDAFTTTATTDTVTITGAATTDYYFIQATGSAAPSANDAMRVQKTATGFVVWRSASGTSGLTYDWWRVK